MANLITEKQKKALKLDYRIRLCAVILFMICLLGFFILAYVVPYYVSLDKKDLKVAEQFKSVIGVENKENIGESASQVVARTVEELKVVGLYYQKSTSPSVYFSKVIQNKNSSVRIMSLSFNLGLDGQSKLLVGGIAQSREGLVSFIEDLKVKAGFASVESPISDFAKDRDISFTLNIKINK